ncbi:MAG: HupE/UreJ family protein [Pseudolabrys sp.]
MNLQSARLGSILVALPLSATNAFAHHIMGGRTPATFGDGMLSGLGHPIIGPDHFAAVVAVGCIAAMHSAGALLVVAFIAAMMAGVALHLNGATVPAAEILVALSVIGLGALMLSRRQMSSASAFVLFALVGLVHGYALGESNLWRRANSALRVSAWPRGHSKRDCTRLHGDHAQRCRTIQGPFAIATCRCGHRRYRPGGVDAAGCAGRLISAGA